MVRWRVPGVRGTNEDGPNVTYSLLSIVRSRIISWLLFPNNSPPFSHFTHPGTIHDTEIRVKYAVYTTENNAEIHNIDHRISSIQGCILTIFGPSCSFLKTAKYGKVE